MLREGMSEAEMIRSLNQTMQSMQEQLDRSFQQDREGNLDLKNRRIVRVGKTKARDDAPSRRELEQKSLYETPTGHHKAKSAIIAPGGVRSLRVARERDELVTLGQVEGMVGGSTNAVLTSAQNQVVEGAKVFLGLCLKQFITDLVPHVSVGFNNVDMGSPSVGGLSTLIGPTQNFTITGLQRNSSNLGGFDGQLIVLHNHTAFRMTLTNESLNSIQQNRFLLPSSSLVNIRAGGSMLVIYSVFDQRWIPVYFA